jgi:hypothetical protein
VAVDERRAGADEGDEVGALTARQRSWAASTRAKVDLIGLEVRRCT